MELHGKDISVLENSQSFFGGAGSIYIRQSNKQGIYTVRSLEELTNVIIPHFDKHPLLTQKKVDFLFFKSIVELMNNKEHRAPEGLVKIISLRASMNKGLSEGGHAATYSSPFPPYPPSLLPSRRRVTEGLGKTMGWGPVVSPGILIVDRRTADLRASPQSSFGVKDTKLS